MSSDRKYTDKELLFLGYLGAEAKGDIDEAMKMAEYAPSSKSWLVKHLKMEIIEVAGNMLAANTVKAAKRVGELLDAPTTPGAETILKTSNVIFDRAGMTGDKAQTDRAPAGGLVILPVKGQKVSVTIEEDKEDAQG